ncbi:hypothetical protein D3H35_21125 [Cohnella faecalis]|uniref:Uncharacterized protein n=1 Tax=Cohnella faecalis TaxID=2315694 RepID=A0A398CTC9_9BACL|nr:hypothetical protein D3H35_21125 [Cohnella faecalis]
MKKSWRDLTKTDNWKAKTKSASGLTQRIGGKLKGKRFENPVRSVGMKLFLLIFCSIWRASLH